jgi:hypothetical protein
VGGIDLAVAQVTPAGSTFLVLIFLPQNVTLGTQVPLTIAIDGRASTAAFLNIRAN